MKRFSNRLKELRKEYGLRQIDLAEKLGYARTTIANYEQTLRFPPIDTLFEIADFFQVSLDYLLGRTNIRLSPEKIIYERINAPMLIIDPLSGNIYDCNNIALDFYGYDKTQIRKMNISSINVLPREIIKEKMTQAIKKEQGIFKFKHRLADGKVKEVLILSGPLSIDNKNFLYSVVYDLSVINRKVFTEITTAVTALSRVFDYHYPYISRHHKKVSAISYNIGKKLNLSSDSMGYLKIAGKIHDIGLLMVPIEIGNNYGELKKNELEIYREHANFGAELVENIDKKLSLIIKQHHEHIDGSGYPEGLGKSDILYEAKIIAVADIIDLIANSRENKDLSYKIITSHLKKYKGIRYDNTITDTAIKLLEKDQLL